MSVRDEIVRLVAPPEREIPAADWNAVEAYLGTDLPSGYKWLVETYGSGAWGAEGFDRIVFSHPNQVGESLLDLMQSKRDALLSRRERFGDGLLGGVSRRQTVSAGDQGDVQRGAVQMAPSSLVC